MLSLTRSWPLRWRLLALYARSLLMIVVTLTIFQIAKGEFYPILCAIFLALHTAAFVSVLAIGWLLASRGIVKIPASMPIGLRPTEPLTPEQNTLFRLLLANTAIGTIVASVAVLYLNVFHPDTVIRVVTPFVILPFCAVLAFFFWSYRRAQRVGASLSPR